MADIIDRVEDAFQERTGFGLQANLVYACLAGSQAHNTHNPDAGGIDDIDAIAVVVPPRSRVYGLHPWKGALQIQQERDDVTVYSATRLFKLLLKGNPNVISTLWVLPSHRLYVHPFFERTLALRRIFSALPVYTAFRGYAGHQFKKMRASQLYRGYMGAKRKELVDKFGYDPKNAAHVIRLLRMCSEFLVTGEFRVWRTTDADYIRNIKAGRHSLNAVEAEAERLFARTADGLRTSTLPAQPDETKAEALLMSLLHRVWWNHG